TALAFVAGVRYLIWRVTSSMDDTPLVLTLTLFIGEAYALVSLFGFAFTAWRLRPTERRRPRRFPAVDVYVPTYDESDEVLRSTLAGCLSLDYPAASIWVLDDGRRRWVRDLAAE